MNDFLAFVLPPAVALAGARLAHLTLGKSFASRFGLGLRFALGLAVGMLVFSQVVFLAAILGFNAAPVLAWLALIWGLVEVALLAANGFPRLKQVQPQPVHLWLLGLLPVVYAWWIFGRLSTLEGTLEFDANAFWVFKSKIFYLTQGKALAWWFHKPRLSYMHWQYPTLVSCLYTLGYGAVGGVDEFINKVWPFWMMVALTLAILSVGNVWKHPHPLPIAVAILVGFLPGSLQFIREEGGTIPLTFYTSLSSLMIVQALTVSEDSALAAAVLTLAGCAATKLEGVVFAGICFCVLVPFIWQRGWWRRPVLWKTVGVGAACMLPYALYRGLKPAVDPASGWWHEAVAAPAQMLARFIEVWCLSIFGRFFNQDFFHWSTGADGHLSWAGKWSGFDSLFNQDLAVLPWLILFLLAMGLWKGKGNRRPAILRLTLVITAVLTALAFVITGFVSSQSDATAGSFHNVATDFCSNVAGRLYFPFFVGWFVGLAYVWFREEPLAALQPNQPLPKA